MQNFIEKQNIANYKALLQTETDPEKIRVIRQLLADEEAKQAARQASSNPARHAAGDTKAR
jgi:hypothetical protein